MADVKVGRLDHDTTLDTWAFDRGRTRVSLKALFGGLLVSLSAEVVMVALGGAIGLSIFEPTEGVAKGVGIGLGVWFLFTVCASLFLGAWAAVAISGSAVRREGLLHGLLTWSAVTLVGLWIVGSFGGGVASLLGGAADTAAKSPALNRQLEQNAPSVKEKASGLVERTQRQFGTPAGRAELGQAADSAATGVAFGLWGLFVAQMLSLGAALLGSYIGVRDEAHHGRRQAVTARPVHGGFEGPAIPQPT